VNKLTEPHFLYTFLVISAFHMSLHYYNKHCSHLEQFLSRNTYVVSNRHTAANDVATYQFLKFFRSRSKRKALDYRHAELRQPISFVPTASNAFRCLVVPMC
jgi:hypothetical protein